MTESGKRPIVHEKSDLMDGSGPLQAKFQRKFFRHFWVDTLKWAEKDFVSRQKPSLNHPNKSVWNKLKIVELARVVFSDSYDIFQPTLDGCFDINFLKRDSRWQAGTHVRKLADNQLWESRSRKWKQLIKVNHWFHRRVLCLTTRRVDEACSHKCLNKVFRLLV